MGGFSELDIHRRNGETPTTLHEIAAALGGEIDGIWIRCPSPGSDPDDRSCYIRIDPAYPSRFFIYDCEGPQGRAYARIREQLSRAGITEAQHPASNSWHAILDEANSATGTLVQRYLIERGITVPVPQCLQFHPALFHGTTRSRWPAMIAVRVSVDGTPVAIHRTYLSPDGRSKAPVVPQKMDLGSVKGSVIRLSPLREELMIGEGIETTLSAIQATGRAGWAAGSAIGLRNLALPPSVTAVIILADGDDPGEAAARAAAARWLDEGRRVRIARAPEGKDFNDLLMAGKL